jgi:alpha-mannosidase
MSGMIEVGVLRSPTSIGSNFTVPESAWENGAHTFRFALQPFQGELAASGAYALGTAFNARPLTAVGAVEPGAHSLLALDAPGVAFSAFKHAERGEGYILRTFETMGQAVAGRIRTAFPIARAAECDLMEQPVRDVELETLNWRAFEIKTLRIWTGGSHE